MDKSEVLIMRIDGELKDRLQTASKDAGVSMSEYIRRLIRLSGSVNWDTGVVTFSTDTRQE